MRFVATTSRQRTAASLVVTVVAAAVVGVPVRAQDGDDQVTLKARLVNIDVLVRDKKGAYVRDLTRDDFVVVENGAVQSVEFLDPPTGAPSQPAAAERAAPAAQNAGGGVPSALEAPPRTIVSLLLDLQTTDSTELTRVATGAERFIRERVSASDAVA